MEGLTARLAGLDFGARSAGTTVLAMEEEGIVRLERIGRGKDADVWLRKRLSECPPQVLAIDAPLSLPGVYCGRGGNYHFRRCDLLMGAMSPMFLGGLSARAMALKATLARHPIHWVETYPRQVALLRLGISSSGTAQVMAALRALCPDTGWPEPEDQHALDALLALYAARMVWERRGVYFGDPREGLIAL
jgi:uncharacterized protein